MSQNLATIKKCARDLARELRRSRAAGRGHPDLALNRLIDFYKTGETATRFEVVTQLSGINFDSSHDFLKQVLRDDKNSVVRHEAAFALGRSKGYSALTDLANACLKDPSPIVRHEAAMALADLNEPNAIPYLLEGLKDPDEEVVISCEYALEVIRGQTIDMIKSSTEVANVK